MRITAWLLLAGVRGALGGVAMAAPPACPADAVEVGTACVGTYEESVWRVPPGNDELVAKARRGRVSLAALQAAGGVESTTPVTGMPSGVIRGGNFGTGSGGGVYAIFASIPPDTQSRRTGFRCAR